MNPPLLPYSTNSFQDVSKLPSGATPPKGILVEELDQHAASLQSALRDFDTETNTALEADDIIQASKSREHDIMPREELFLISSFLLNFRQAAIQVAGMLEESRLLLEERHQNHNRRRLYAPKIHWSKWLSGGGESGALPTSGRKAARQGRSDDHISDGDASRRQTELAHPSGNDLEQQRQEESSVNIQSTKSQDNCTVKVECCETLPFSLRIRGKAADALEWMQGSEDLLYALRLTFAGFLVIWPALVPSLNSWYSLERGSEYPSKIPYQCLASQFFSLC